MDLVKKASKKMNLVIFDDALKQLHGTEEEASKKNTQWESARRKGKVKTNKIS